MSASGWRTKNKILLAALGLLATVGDAQAVYWDSDRSLFPEYINPFTQLGVNLELGTTGIGLDVATPLSVHFFLKAGFSILPYTYKTKIDFGIPPFNIINPDLRERLETWDLPTSSEAMPTQVDINGKLGLTNGRVLLDYYPSTTSDFHLTVGAYIGQNYLMHIEGYLSPTFVTAINIINDFATASPDEEVSVSLPAINGEEIDINSLGGKIDATIKTSPVKPYFGLGFGHSIPRQRIGFQFEIGAMYLGKPAFSSTDPKLETALNKPGDDFKIAKYIKYLYVYPVIAFKLTGKIL